MGKKVVVDVEDFADVLAKRFGADPADCAGLILFNRTSDFTRVFEPSATAAPEGYEELTRIFNLAIQQAASGKGKERHQANNDPFHRQPIVTIGEQCLNSPVFNIGQMYKKASEALRMGKDRAIKEVLGALNYGAAAVCIIEKWPTGMKSGFVPEDDSKPLMGHVSIRPGEVIK